MAQQRVSGQVVGGSFLTPPPHIPSRHPELFCCLLLEACVSPSPAVPVHLLAPPRSCSPRIQALGGDWVEAELAAGQDLNGDLGAFSETEALLGMLQCLQDPGLCLQDRLSCSPTCPVAEVTEPVHLGGGK